ncbi:DUF58 domain-containing protein [Chloroflexota bacterium]
MRVIYTRIYLMLAFVTAATLSPLPYSAIAVVLLLCQLYLVWRNMAVGLVLLIDLFCIIMLALVLDPVIPYSLAVLLVFPVLPLMDRDLRGIALRQPFTIFTERKQISNTLKSILIALVLVLLISLLTATYILSISVAVLLIYLGWRGFNAWRMLSDPLNWQQNVEFRLIAGDSKQMSIEFKNNTGKPLLIQAEGAYGWIKVDPPQFELADTATIEVTVALSLAGPSSLPLKLSIRDRLGLLQADRTIDCARLIVIPRARYSAWLAQKYLEHGAAAIGGAAASYVSASLPVHGNSGMEYHSSHVYSPGDKIKDIDWKHTIRLREIVVKKYQDMYGNAAVILVNLTTGSADEADVISSNLVNSVLTLALSSINAVLVAYNELEVVELTSVMPANALLKKVLGLVGGITFTRSSIRYLSPPDIRRLNRTRRELANVDMEPAKHLLDILDIEVEAVKMSTSRHPLSAALGRITSVVAPPAMMVPITLFNHDAEALNYILPRMEGRGYRVFPFGVQNPLVRRTRMPPA